MMNAKLVTILSLAKLLIFNPSPASKKMDRVENSTVYQIEKSTKLQLVGRGGSMNEKITSTHLTFQHNGNLSIDQSRNYIIYCSEKLMHNINTKKDLTKYLDPYPFDIKNIELSLFVEPTKKAKNNLEMVTCKEGVINYYTFPVQGHGKILVHSETYEEALEIVGDISEIEKELREPKLINRLYKNCKNLFPPSPKKHE